VTPISGYILTNYYNFLFSSTIDRLKPIIVVVDHLLHVSNKGLIIYNPYMQFLIILASNFQVPLLQLFIPWFLCQFQLQINSSKMSKHSSRQFRQNKSCKMKFVWCFCRNFFFFWKKYKSNPKTKIITK